MNQVILNSLLAQQIFMTLLATCFMGILTYDTVVTKIQYFRKDLLIIFGLIFLSLSTLLIIEWKVEGLFFAIALSSLITFSLIAPKYAVGLFVYLLLSRPWETFDATFMSALPRDVSLLVILSIFAQRIINREFFIKLNIGSIILLLFAFWMLLSAIFSHHQQYAIQNFVEIFSKAIIIFLLIQNAVLKSDDIIPIKCALVISILEKGIISYFNSAGNERLESVGALANSNDIAAIFVLVIPFIFFMISRSNIPILSKTIAALLVFTQLYLVWQSKSRGAILGVVAMIAALFYFKVNNKKVFIALAIISLMSLGPVFKLMGRKGGDLEGSTNNRLIFWKAGINMAIRNPFFGVGFWGFNENFANYAIGGDTGSEGTHMTAHSSWVLTVAEGGPVALILFLSLWLYTFFLSFKLINIFPEYFFSICGYGTAMSFLSHTYLLYPYILLALIISHYFSFDNKQLMDIAAKNNNNEVYI